MQPGIQIGRAAEQTGLSVDTIRFYQRIGLLPQSARSAGGVRLFTEREINNLLFIQHAQELGFSLTEIKQLALLNQQRDHACPQVRDLLKTKLRSVHQKLSQLRHLEKELSSALRACSRGLRSSEIHSAQLCCPVLKTLEHKGPTARPRRVRSR